MEGQVYSCRCWKSRSARCLGSRVDLLGNVKSPCDSKGIIQANYVKMSFFNERDRLGEARFLVLD